MIRFGVLFCKSRLSKMVSVKTNKNKNLTPLLKTNITIVLNLDLQKRTPDLIIFFKCLHFCLSLTHKILKNWRPVFCFRFKIDFTRCDRLLRQLFYIKYHTKCHLNEDHIAINHLYYEQIY